MGADLVIGANTIVEVTHSRTTLPRLNWALSRIKVEPVTEQAAKAAAEFLEDTGLHGHKYATVAEVALRQPKPVALLTSDSDDMTKLCGSQVRIIPPDQPARPDHAAHWWLSCPTRAQHRGQQRSDTAPRDWEPMT